MNNESAPTKTFRKSLWHAIVVTSLAFTLSIVFYILTGTPRFGYYLLGASAIYTCYTIAAWVFVIALGLFSFSNSRSMAVVSAISKKLDEEQKSTSEAQ